MTSMRWQDTGNGMNLIKQCANKTCGARFFVTEDIRQLYCCRSCSRAEASRRKNARKRRIAAHKEMMQDFMLTSALVANPSVPMAKLEIIETDLGFNVQAERIGPLVKGFDVRTILQSEFDRKLLTHNEVKTKETLVRKYIFIYDPIDDTYEIAYSDHGDFASMWIKSIDMPAFNDRSAVARVVMALNKMEASA